MTLLTTIKQRAVRNVTKYEMFTNNPGAVTYLDDVRSIVVEELDQAFAQLRERFGRKRKITGKRLETNGYSLGYVAALTYVLSNLSPEPQKP